MVVDSLQRVLDVEEVHWNLFGLIVRLNVSLVLGINWSVEVRVHDLSCLQLDCGQIYPEKKVKGFD